MPTPTHTDTHEFEYNVHACGRANVGASVPLTLILRNSWGFIFLTQLDHKSSGRARLGSGGEYKVSPDRKAPLPRDIQTE